MKGYGLPRNWDVGAPDRADCCNYGLKSCYSGRLRSKPKRASRRVWKRQARIAGKIEVIEQYNE